MRPGPHETRPGLRPTLFRAQTTSMLCVNGIVCGLPSITRASRSLRLCSTVFMGGQDTQMLSLPLAVVVACTTVTSLPVVGKESAFKWNFHNSKSACVTCGCCLRPSSSQYYCREALWCQCFINSHGSSRDSRRRGGRCAVSYQLYVCVMHSRLVKRWIVKRQW